jgi:hypothetical protein
MHKTFLYFSKIPAHFLNLKYNLFRGKENKLMPDNTPVDRNHGKLVSVQIKKL